MTGALAAVRWTPSFRLPHKDHGGLKVPGSGTTSKRWSLEDQPEGLNKEPIQSQRSRIRTHELRFLGHRRRQQRAPRPASSRSVHTTWWTPSWSGSRRPARCCRPRSTRIFPSMRRGGLNVFHVVPQAAAPGADRSRGTEADEIRLFYVAVTQVRKFLALSYSPGDSQMYRARSQFFDFTTRNSYILTVPISPSQSRLEPRVQAEDITRD